MAIVRNGKRSRVSNPNLNFSPESVDASSLDNDSDGGSDYDSGMESDGGDSVDAAAEVGAEVVQLGDQSFTVPIELYDLKDLSFLLSVCNWNELLTEEERFYLSKYLPDIDRETLGKTLIELLGGENFHFGSPAVDFLGKLKGGEFEPGVNVYRQGLSCFRKREYYYQIRKYHNSMVSGLFRIRGAWEKCKGYGVEERLRLLNIMGSRSNFGDENGGDLEQEVDPGDEHFLKKRIKFGHKTPEGHCVARGKGFGRSRYQKMDIVGHDNGERDYEFSAHRDRNGSRRSTMTRAGLSKAEKKQWFLRRYDEFGEEEDAGFPDLTGRRKNLNAVTIASYVSDPNDNLKKNNYSVKDWINATKIQSSYQTGAQVDWSEGNLRTLYPVELDGAVVSSKKWKVREEFGWYKSKHGSDSAVRPYKSSPASNGSAHRYSDHVSKILKEKNVKSKVGQTGSMDMEYSRGSIIFDQSEETESDSSDQDEEDADTNPLVKQSEYPNGAIIFHQSRTDRSVFDPAKVNKLTTNGENPCIIGLENRSNTHAPEVESYLRHGKQKAYSSRERRQESAVSPVQSLLKRNYRDVYSDVQAEEVQDALNVTYNLHNVHVRAIGSRSQAQNFDHPDVKTNCNKEAYLLACKAVARKRMGKLEDYHEEPYESVYKKLNTNKKMDGPDMKKKRKIDVTIGLSTDITPDPYISLKEDSDNEQETRPYKKNPNFLITPTIHTGFSFSIIHLLSAIRKAMITADLEDVIDGGRHIRKDDATREVLNNTIENGTSSLHSHKNEDANTLEHSRQNFFPSLTVQEIANHVRSNPGDPCILETQEPLQDLIRGVLKILSSKTAPLGAKGWKPLVSYEKSNKGWSWVGPVSSSLSGNDIIEEETSPDAWGIPYRMLVNLVNGFANWLKSSQETLKQIGSLPAPPISMLANLDEKERFRDLKTQRNPHTIDPSSDEQRAYFHKEEYLRYSIPDRAFSYTAADGKKSSVAPLRRGAGKPTSKARDHYILKHGRPPHVTILCLVRDAAARLPGSIGTRADVCTLIRDSQYIVEHVTDMQVNQVVSGALDRLHYELDPCIHFDNDRKLWVYLHRNREEEDFEDDGTSSTKNWKKPKKDFMEPSDLDATNDVSYHGNGDLSEIGPSTGFDLNADANDDPSHHHTDTVEKLN